MGALLARTARDARVQAAIAPAMPDVGRLARDLPLPVLSQHMDEVAAGARTGSVPGEALRAAGAMGSLLNHSEHPVDRETVRRTLARMSELGLVAVVCAQSVEEVAALAAFRPPWLAIEPPELIGGRIAVSRAKPELVSESVDVVSRISPGTRVLCGAGIHDREDVATALRLGSHGVLVASAVTTAADPAATLGLLLAGFGQTGAGGRARNAK